MIRAIYGLTDRWLRVRYWVVLWEALRNIANKLQQLFPVKCR